MTNPIVELLEQLEKEAAPDWGHVGRRIGDAALAGGVTALGAGAVGAVAAAAQKIYEAGTHGRDFRRMLDYNPDLHEYQRRDPKLFGQHFTSLRAMNAEFSADPIVAGTFMRQMSDNPMNAGGMLQAAQQGAGRTPTLLSQMRTEGMGAAKGSLKNFSGRPAPPGHASPSWDRSDD